MRVIIVLALLCLLQPIAGRRINKNTPESIKSGGGPLADEDYEDEEEILDEEEEVFDPNAIKKKCRGLPEAEDRVRCVCESAEGAGLSPEDVTKRCKSLRMTIFAMRAFGWSCKHAPLVDGCKPFKATSIRKRNPPAPEKRVSDDDKKEEEDLEDLDDLEEEEDDAGPEEKQEDEKKQNDDVIDEELDEELEEDDEEAGEDLTGLCARVCLPSPKRGIGMGCDFFPPLSYKGADKQSFCEKDCEDVGGLCIDKAPGGGGGGGAGGGGAAPVVVEERASDEENRKDDVIDDLEDDLEEDEEDLGESDDIQKEKEKEPTLTCASLVKSATPGKLATQAQLKKWCGSQTCGTKLKMRTWAICGLADGRVSGPGYGGVVGDANGAFDCYINCKGEAEKISGFAEDCLSSMGGWGRCSRDCGGGSQRRQLNIRKYPTGGGKSCPVPPSQRCNTHKCKDCFPADASVETVSGMKRMSELRVGDHVRSVDGAGKLTYDEVYFFGHAESSMSTEYVDLKLSGNDASLQLSRKHFLPACPEHGMRCKWAEHIHIYAQDVLKGDFIWVATDDQTSLREVLERSVVVKNGLYNPYTLSGKIVVNGVVASTHSNWVLDDWTPSSMSQYLPAAYQLLFLPGRLLYQVVGTPAADFLDVNNPSLAAAHGYGPEFLGMSIVGGLIVTVMALRGTCSK